jgi:hypothetical protein
MGDGIVGKLDWSFSIFHGTGKSTSTTGPKERVSEFVPLVDCCFPVGPEGVLAKIEARSCTFFRLYLQPVYGNSTTSTDDSARLRK